MTIDLTYRLFLLDSYEAQEKLELVSDALTSATVRWDPVSASLPSSG